MINTHFASATTQAKCNNSNDDKNGKEKVNIYPEIFMNDSVTMKICETVQRFLGTAS